MIKASDWLTSWESLLGRLCLWFHFYRERNIHQPSLFYCPFLFPFISFLFPVLSSLLPFVILPFFSISHFKFLIPVLLFLFLFLPCSCFVLFFQFWSFHSLFPLVYFSCPVISFFPVHVLSFSFRSDPFIHFSLWFIFPVLLFPSSLSCFVIMFFFHSPYFLFWSFPFVFPIPLFPLFSPFQFHN